MDTAAKQIAGGGVNEAMTGDGAEPLETGRAQPDVVVTTLPSSGMTGVQRGVVADEELGRGQLLDQTFAQ